VISISYAWNEADFTPGYLEQQCLEFLKLALQGVSVVAATGDWGVADQRSNCIDPSTGLPALPGQNPSNGTKDYHFSATFPSSCPWVTAVGGTSLSPLFNGTQPTWNQSNPSFPPQIAYRVAGDNSPTGRGASTSNGGFSRMFSTPEYQTGEVSSYLAAQQNHTESFAGRFNPGGRGYPDVALAASNYLVVYDGALYTISGTSAATPVFAAMLARINNERLLGGKGPVGFVNNVLYRHKEIFEDVKEGANEGCGLAKAFQAAEGWDAVTGLGAPNFEKMREVFVGLP
jgi:tripeptidyl-peptidase I